MFKFLSNYLYHGFIEIFEILFEVCYLTIVTNI